MTDITLYTHPVSANSHRVKLLLSLLDVPHGEVTIDLLKGEQYSPGFAEVNGWRRLPVLKDRDLVFNESYAILIYVARQYGEESGEQWWPHGQIKQARVARWMFFTADELHNGIGLARNEFGFGIPSSGAYAMERAMKALALLDAHLADREWFELERPTLADVSIYPFIAVAPEAGIDLSAYSNLANWLARVSALPSFVPMPRLLPDKAPRP